MKHNKKPIKLFEEWSEYAEYADSSEDSIVVDKNEDYELIKITNFEDAQKYAYGTKWVMGNEDAYNSYLESYHIYVLLCYNLSDNKYAILTNKKTDDILIIDAFDNTVVDEADNVNIIDKCEDKNILNDAYHTIKTLQ